MPGYPDFGVSDGIAIFALLMSGASVFYARHAIRAAAAQFDRTERREHDVLVAANYLALETASSAIFQYTAEIASRIEPIRGARREEDWHGDERADARETLVNLYFQSLNLFEVCARFRRHDQLRPEVFASWVAWFAEILEDDFFRARWPVAIRENYTRDVRDIFDVGVEIFDTVDDAGERLRALYAAVADIMDCPVIADWPADIEKAKRWNSLPSAREFPSAGTSLPIPAAPPPLSPPA